MNNTVLISAVIGAVVIIALIIAAAVVLKNRAEQETSRRKSHDDSIVEATKIAVHLLRVSTGQIDGRIAPMPELEVLRNGVPEKVAR
jgi:hypothetical protein